MLRKASSIFSGLMEESTNIIVAQSMMEGGSDADIWSVVTSAQNA